MGNSMRRTRHEASRQDLNNTINALMEQIEERQKETQRLTSLKNEAEQSSTELQNQITSLTDANEDLNRQILQRANHITELKDENTQIQAKVKELEGDCSLKEKMIGVLNSKQQLIEGIRESEDILRKENNELRKQSRRLRENEESLRAENMILRKQRRNENYFLAQVSTLFDPEQPWVLARGEIAVTENRASGRRITGSYRGVKVTLKEFTKNLDNEQNRSDFDLEVLFHSLCRHPCIIQFIGVTEPTFLEEHPVIVTEIFETSLQDMRKKGNKIDTQKVPRIAKDLFAALCYLHEFKPDAIIHRDVSPGNIMILGGTASTWRVKVADLGSAVFEVDEKTDCPGEAFYSAPEASNLHRQTVKMDIFSLGVCLLEMLAGEFQVQTVVGKWALVRSKVQNSQMRQLLLDCLKENPESRPSAKTVVRELEIV